MSTFIINLCQQIDTIVNAFVFEGYTALADILKAPLGAMIVLYITLMGYAMVRGLIQTPQQELFKFTIRSGLIYTLAMNWAFFSSHVRDLFVVSSETLANTLMHAVDKTHASGSINQGLQHAFDDILTLGTQTMAQGSYRHLSPYFAGMMIYLAGLINVGISLAEIILAKIMIALTLCTAPLFITLTLFEQTKSFFERWLGVLVGFSLVLVFVSGVLGLCLHIMHWSLAEIHHHHDGLLVSSWVPLFIVSCLCALIVTQAAAIAKSIGGSVCTSGGADLVGGFIGSAMGSSNIAGKMATVVYGKTLQRPVHAATRIYQNIRRGGA